MCQIPVQLDVFGDDLVPEAVALALQLQGRFQDFLCLHLGINLLLPGGCKRNSLATHKPTFVLNTWLRHMALRCSNAVQLAQDGLPNACPC